MFLNEEGNGSLCFFVFVAVEPDAGETGINCTGLVREHRLHVGPRTTDGRPLHELRVNALVLSPVAGSEVRGESVEVSGVAWGGEDVDAVEVRVGSGAWTEATITPPPSGMPPPASACTGLSGIVASMKSSFRAMCCACERYL